MPDKATKSSFFWIVYGYNSLTPLGLVLIPTFVEFRQEADERVKEIKELCSEVKERIDKSNEQAGSQAIKHKNYA